MKKGIALVLAAVIFTSILTGCESEKKEDTGAEIEKNSSAETQGSEAAPSVEKIDYTKYPVTPVENFEYEERTKAELEESFHVKLDTTAENCIIINKFYSEDDDVEAVVVPSEIDGKPVVGVVGGEFYFVNGVQGNEKVKAIILPDTIEVIAGNFAFSLDNLETLYLGNKLKCLGYEYAYDRDFLFKCPKIKELVFPDTLERIGELNIYSAWDHVLERIHIPEATVGQNYFFNDKWSDTVTDGRLIVECASNSYAEHLCDEDYIMSQNYQGTRDLENYKQNREKLSKFYGKYMEISGGAHNRYLIVNEEFGISALSFDEESGVAVVEDKGNGYHEGTIDKIKVFTQDIPEETTKQYNATTYEGVEKMALDIVNHAMAEQQAGGEILDYVTIDSSHGPMTVVATGVKAESKDTAYGTNHGEHFILWKIYSDKIIGVRNSWFLLARTITPLN